MADLLVLPQPAESLQDSAENLNKLGLPKRKELPRCHKVSSCQVHQSRLYQISYVSDIDKFSKYFRENFHKHCQ